MKKQASVTLWTKTIPSLTLVDWLTQAGMPLTDRRLRQIADEGFFPPPVKGEYRMPETVIGIIRYQQERIAKATDKKSVKDQIGQEKLRQERVAADQAEGVVVSKDEGRRLVTRFFSQIKSKALGIGKRLAQRLAIESDPVKVEQAIDGEVRDVLSVAFDWGLWKCPHCKKDVHQ